MFLTLMKDNKRPIDPEVEAKFNEKVKDAEKKLKTLQ